MAEPERAAAIEEGAKAFLDGVPLRANPYRSPAAGHGWAHGWQAEQLAVDTRAAWLAYLEARNP